MYLGYHRAEKSCRRNSTSLCCIWGFLCVPFQNFLNKYIHIHVPSNYRPYCHRGQIAIFVLVMKTFLKRWHKFFVTLTQGERAVFVVVSPVY